MRHKILFGLIVSTLFIEKLWKFTPYSEELHHLFLYSDTLISYPTYYWFFCLYLVKLIYIRVWCVFLPQYWMVFNTWFIFQILEVVEFYFAYNEPQIFIYGFGLTVEKFKYVAIVITLTIQLWMSQSQAGRS
jgi:hypothetical protein